MHFGLLVAGESASSAFASPAKGLGEASGARNAPERSGRSGGGWGDEEDEEDENSVALV